MIIISKPMSIREDLCIYPGKHIAQYFSKKDNIYISGTEKTNIQISNIPIKNAIKLSWIHFGVKGMIGFRIPINIAELLIKYDTEYGIEYYKLQFFYDTESHELSFRIYDDVTMITFLTEHGYKNVTIQELEYLMKFYTHSCIARILKCKPLAFQSTLYRNGITRTKQRRLRNKIEDIICKEDLIEYLKMYHIKPLCRKLSLSWEILQIIIEYYELSSLYNEIKKKRIENKKRGI